MSGFDPSKKQRLCAVCSKYINLGDGGDRNFIAHEKSGHHQAKLPAADRNQAPRDKNPLTIFFSRLKESHYALAEGEEAALKTISKAKKRKSTKRRISFKISPQHSTKSALGEFGEVLGKDYSPSTSRSPSPDNDPDQSAPPSDNEDEYLAILPNIPSPARTLPPLDEEDEDMPPASGLPSAMFPPAHSTPVATTAAVIAMAPQAATATTSQPAPVAPATVSDLVASAQSDNSSNRRSKRVRKPAICADPRCSMESNLCCVGIHETEHPDEWFCDEDCRDNAGRGRKKTRRN